MCELARVLVNRSWLINIAALSTRDLQEQGRESYEASYQADEQLVILQMFSLELSQ